MSRISRYVFKEILGPTLLGLLIYGLVLLMNLLLEAAELFIRRDLPATLVAQYVVLSLPRILVLVIPMAVLLGVLAGVGRLSSDNEITALRASGYSDRRLLTPVLAVGLAASVVCLLLFNIAVPRANYTQHQLNARIFLSADINREIQPRVFYERIPNLLIYADAASAADGTLQRVLIYKKTTAGQEELSSAATASMSQQAVRGDIEFHLQDVISHSWQAEAPDLYQVTRYADQVIDRPPDVFTQELIRSLSTPPPRNVREQTVPELRRTLEELRAKPTNNSVRRQIGETLVELHKKFSLPATSAVFALVGLPLALGHRRTSGRTWGFVMSLVIIIISYVMLTAGEQLADRGVVPPWLGMWAGNIFFLIIGIALISTRSRFDLRVTRRGLRRRFLRLRQAAAPARSPEQPLEGTQPDMDAPAGRTTTGMGARRLPSTIDRYLLRHLAILATFVALSLLILFTLFHGIELIDDLVRGEKPTSLLLTYLFYLAPQILFSYVAPISLCIGTLISFALLARTHELTAIRAGGVSLYRVAGPFLAAAATFAAASFAVHDAVLPYTNQKANQVRDQIRNRSPRSYRQPERRWVFGSQGLLVNFGDFSRKKTEFQDLAVFRFQPGTFEISQRVFAARAIWLEGAWTLQQGWTRLFDHGVEKYVPFNTMKLDELDPPDYFAQDWKAPDQMNFRELRRYVRDLEQRGYDTRDLRVGLYRKVSIPLVPVVMVLIGLPFALRVERRGPALALGVSIVLVFIYYGVLQAFGKMGEVALLPPLLAAWAPNILFGGMGLYLTSTARW